MFNEETLRAEIARTWGEHGAHMDVYDQLLRVLEAARFSLSQSEPCDACQEGDCDPDRYCPCDHGCHNGVEAARMALNGAVYPYSVEPA